MDLPDLPDAADAAGDAARWAWKNWDVAAKRFAALRGWFAGRAAPAESGEEGTANAPPVRPILLLGPGGVGKTTFARLIAGGGFLPPEPPDDGANYRESLNVITYRFEDAADADAVVVDPPGQPHRRADDWDELLGQLSAGRFRGVMLFAAYGYHTLPQFGGYRSHPLFDAGNTRARFVRKYATDCREDEVRVAGRVAAALQKTPEPTWLLTCVTKEDLWWPDGDAVETFYSRGPFAEALDAGLGGSDPGRVRRERALCSFGLLNLRDRRGEILVKNAAGYDHPQQAESARRLTERLDDLRVWETQR